MFFSCVILSGLQAVKDLAWSEDDALSKEAPHSPFATQIAPNTVQTMRFKHAYALINAVLWPQSRLVCGAA
jgi:hypothetical protein